MMTTNEQNDGQAPGLGFNLEEFKRLKRSKELLELGVYMRNLLETFDAPRGSEKDFPRNILLLVYRAMLGEFIACREGRNGFSTVMRPFFRNVPEDVRAEDEFLKLFLAASRYVMDALKSLDIGDWEAAWKNTSHVLLLRTVMKSGHEAEEVGSFVKTYLGDVAKNVNDIRKILSESGKIGAKKRHEPTNKVKAFALAEFDKKTWKSNKDAARRLAPVVAKFRDGIKAKAPADTLVSPADASMQDTLEKWFGKHKQEKDGRSG